MTLPTLYKKTKTGKIQQYDVRVDGSTIYVTQGQTDGKKQTYPTVITEGKNISKANETTPAEQAISEARSKHAKKIKAGYSTNPEGTITKLLPQKVKVYQDLFTSAKTQENLVLPCLVEPKLNGVNGSFRLSNSLELFSRGGEDYPIPPHQIDPITDIMQHFGLPELNVEEYTHGAFLEDIQSAIKKNNPNTQHLIAYIFELPGLDMDYAEKVAIKYDIMDYITKKGYQNAVQVVIPKRVGTLDEIELTYIQCMSMGFEGLIVTNMRSRYKHNIRSSDVWKYKIAQDAEFQIVDCEADKSGHPVFHCTTKEGGIFKVKPKGTDEQRKAIIDSFESKYLHQWYKVEFECYSKKGIPQKPVGVGLRKCDSDGKPLE